MLRRFRNSSTRRRKICTVARDGECARRSAERRLTDFRFFGKYLVVSWIPLVKSVIAVRTAKEKIGNQLTSRFAARNYLISTSLDLRLQVLPLPNDHFPFPSNSSFTALASPLRTLKDASTLSTLSALPLRSAEFVPRKARKLTLSFSSWTKILAKTWIELSPPDHSPTSATS